MPVGPFTPTPKPTQPDTHTDTILDFNEGNVLNSNSPGVADPDEVASLVGCVRIRIQAQPCDLNDPTRSSGAARQASIWWHHVDTWQEENNTCP